MFQTIISFINLIPPAVFKLAYVHCTVCIYIYVKTKSLKTTFRYVCLNISCLKGGFKKYLYITYATLAWSLRWKSWESKMTAYPILIFMQSFIKFQMMVQEIQMKRAKRDILTYLHTDQPSHRISISWLKNHVIPHGSAVLPEDLI